VVVLDLADAVRHRAAMTNDALALRIDRLEAESAIRALAARYCFEIDNHDLLGVGELFTKDARVHCSDGVMDATSRDALIRQYEGRFPVLSGTIAIGGPLPLEINGQGLTCEHPGLYGLFAIVESARQLRDEAVSAIECAEIALARTNGGTLSCQGTAIFGLAA
jgi:hypothetical protein